MDDQVEAFQIGFSPGILNLRYRWGSLTHIQHLWPNFFLVDIQKALGFLFPKEKNLIST